MINPGNFPFHLDSLRLFHDLAAEAGIALMDILIRAVSHIILFLLTFEMEACTMNICRARDIRASGKRCRTYDNTEVKTETRIIDNRRSCIKNTIPRT